MGARRFVTASFLSLLAVLLLAMPAGAGVSWCRADPIVMLDGTEVQIWVSVAAEYEHLVTGPIRVAVYAPNRVSKEITFLDAGFNGHGEEVNFKHRGRVRDDGSFPVDIKVRVPLDNRQLHREFDRRDIPVLVEVITGDGQVIHLEGTQHGTAVSLDLRGAH